MGKYWKEPEEESWFQFVVDGKLIGIAAGPEASKEIKRLEGLSGIAITPATKDALIKFNAKTAIPGRIIKRMDELWKKLERKK